MGTGSEASTDTARADGPLSLWWAPLDITASSRRSLADCLSEEERRRAGGYRRPVDRDRFLAARGWLRHLLAGQMLCAPNEVRIVTGEKGKPKIESSDLKFNASRSGGMALYATSWRTEVGVDVEAIRAGAAGDMEDIAARFFSPKERRALASLPPEHRLVASFQCWTCKESYVKGIGTGLDYPIHTVDVWAAESRQATISGWTVHRLEVAPGFAAAVAAEGTEGWKPMLPGKISGPDSDPSPAIIEPRAALLGVPVGRFSGGEERSEPT